MIVVVSQPANHFVGKILQLFRINLHLTTTNPVFWTLFLLTPNLGSVVKVLA